MKSKNKKNSVSNQVKELTELLQKTQANFENYRKQQEKRIQEIQEQANKELIVQLLTVLDNFELAMRSANGSKDFMKGVELIYSQLSGLLGDNGLKPIKTENKVFDPHFHEALMKAESDKPENTIIEELQKGFMLNDKVIRHAKVKISAWKNDKKKVDEQNNQKTNNGGKIK